ncbi:hypothetical protein [Microbacterium nymphoidis]|uniref:hypothetical protein n=1 Tax=Microbacterium nymphoidis TaxID=2898586 RepID=UPI001E51FB91|nr:hypothetical protein [Microbacterium nymphoidis]MCD2498503.1 hypothetical protein [Microbacterium nymphoidis]
MREPQLASEWTKAALGDRIPNGDSNEASDLSCNGDTDAIGPAGRQFRRASAGNSDHAPHRMSPAHGYINNHASPSRLNLQTYRPRDDTHWNEVRDVVLTAIAPVLPDSLTQAQRMAKTAHEFVVWAWQVAACELSIPALFTAANVAQFLAQEGAASIATRSIMSRSLALVVEHVTGSRPATLRTPDDGPTAYSREELAELVSDVQTYSTEYRRLNAMRILLLGRGAGLTALEMGMLTRDSVTPTLIHVPGDRARTAPILPEWRAAVAEHLPASDGYVVLPGRKRHRNPGITIREFLAHLPSGRLSARRLRATWAVDLLEHGASVQEMLAYSGWTSTSNLQRYSALASLPHEEPDAVMARLYGRHS